MLFDFLFFRKTDYTKFEVFLIAFFYSSLSIFLSYVSFKDFASLFSVFLTTLSLIPFLVTMIKNDETFDMKIQDSKRIFSQHRRTLSLFMMMFLGITIAYGVWYALVDFHMRPVLFEAQTHIVSKINGNFGYPEGYKLSFLSQILFNNIKVLIFVMVFSLLYGFGGLFVLTWNASVLGYALGNYFTKALSHGFGIALLKSFLRYFTHGIFEILAYFFASLASGILFISLLRQDFRSKNFDIIIRDVAELVIMGIVILSIAAFIEVFVTPYFY